MTSLAHQSARSWYDWRLQDGNYRYCFRRMSMERKHFRPWSSDETVTLKKTLNIPMLSRRRFMFGQQAFGRCQGSSHVVQLSYHRTNPGPYTTQPFLVIHYCVN